MTINRRAFYGCSKLQSITIPDSITGIHNTAFQNCNQLKSVTINPNILTNIPSPSLGVNVSFFGATVETFLPT